MPLHPDDRDRGVCARRPDLLPLFFSDKSTEQEQARKLCFSCPIQLECLAAAEHEPYGIWGGTLPIERRRKRAADKKARDQA